MASTDITAPPSNVSHEDEHRKSSVDEQKEDQVGVEPADAAAAAAGQADDGMQKPEILSRRKFLPLYFGMLLSVMLISLDQTIVATAQVPIVDSLGGASLITWLPTTFLLGQCSFSLLFGQLMTIFPSKYVYLSAIVLFELGSLVSGVAQNMAAMLAGRTVSGVGAAGIFMGCVQVLVETTTLASRAAYTGALGSLFAISMVVGPLIGGSLADKVTWRWCFYINLPIGGVTVLAIVLLFNARAPLGADLRAASRPSLWTQLCKLDWIGVVLLTGITCMVIVPMQLAQEQAGGWTSAATLAPICLTPVAVALTGAWFWYRERSTKDELRAILPLRMFTDGNLIGCSVATAIIFWIAIEMTYLIPLFYETVVGHTALRSGVDMLGFVLSFGLCAVFGGMLSRISGHYYPQFLVCPLLGVVASALMYTTKVTSSTGFHIGTQILLGLAIGPMIQSPMLALQANCPDKRLIARALSFVAFCQRFGGGVGSSLTGAVLSAQLPSHIRRQLLAINVDPAPYVNTTYDQVRFAPAGPVRDAMLRALTSTMDDICLAGIPLFAIVFIVVVTLVRIRNIKTDKEIMKLDFLARKVLRRSAKEEKPSEA